jgi:NAD(P)H dehydrogenase (quinone)
VQHAGLPGFLAELLSSFNVAARLGYFETVTDDFAQLTGRPATPLSDLL